MNTYTVYSTSTNKMIATFANPALALKEALKYQFTTGVPAFVEQEQVPDSIEQEEVPSW